MGTCRDCIHFNNTGYKDQKLTEDLGFCTRFTQVVAQHEKDCISFLKSNLKELEHRNALRAKQLDLFFNNQLTLFQ